MTEKDFDSLGLTIGDRRALQASFNNPDTKSSAVEKLKDFLKAKNQKRIEKKSSAKKNTLKLEIGWRHGRNKDDYRQVKFPQGGGTRMKDFRRDATYDEVLNVCKDLFFPKGISKRKGISINDVDIFLGNYCGDQVSFIDGEVFTVEKYRNHASVSKGNTPRVYLMTCEKPKNGNEETNDLIPINETSASTSSNITVDQSDKSKETLEDFVHDALSEIGSDNTPDELLMYSPFDDPPTSEFQQHEDNELSTGFEPAALTQSSIERRALIEQQNKEYDEALKADQQKEQEKEKEKEIAREMELLKREREARVLEEPHIEEDHVVVCVRHLRGGIVTRAFYPTAVMQAVYDWIGSLQLDPPHFALFAMTRTQSKTLMYPAQTIVPQTMLYMEQTDDPVPPSALVLVTTAIDSEVVTEVTNS